MHMHMFEGEARKERDREGRQEGKKIKKEEHQTGLYRRSVKYTSLGRKPDPQ